MRVVDSSSLGKRSTKLKVEQTTCVASKFTDKIKTPGPTVATEAATDSHVSQQSGITSSTTKRSPIEQADEHPCAGALFSPEEFDSLDRKKPVPLYEQLYQLMRRKLLSQPGRTIADRPSTEKLATSFGISRVTVDRAIKALAKEGLLKLHRVRLRNERKTIDLFSTEELTSLDRNSAVPLYHQLYRLLQNKIRECAVSAGTYLESSEKVAIHFGVSRVTVDRALQELVKDGVVERARPVGTRILFEPTAREPVTVPLGIAADANWFLNSDHTVVHLIERRRPPRTVGKLLDLCRDEQCLFIAKVAFDRDNAPFAYSENWTTTITRTVSNQDVQALGVHGIFGMSVKGVVRFDHTLGVTVASANAKEHLKLSTSDPVMTLTRCGYAISGSVVDVQTSEFHPNRFCFRLTETAVHRS